MFSFPPPVPEELGARHVQHLGGGRVHAAQPVLRGHQEARVPRPEAGQDLHGALRQGQLDKTVDQ